MKHRKMNFIVFLMYLNDPRLKVYFIYIAQFIRPRAAADNFCFRQSHVNRTIPMVCIDRALLQDNVSRIKPGTYLRIIRMENEGSIKVFQSSDVFAKRSVIKGGDILRTLAVYEMREKFDFEVSAHRVFVDDPYYLFLKQFLKFQLRV